MYLSKAHADQIAELLNERNQLTTDYTGQKIIEHAADFKYCLSEADEVVACVEVKKVQWYQAEVLHLTVSASQVRKGLARFLLDEAERCACDRGARLLQCTIRQDNVPSRNLFLIAGFVHVCTFHNQLTGNNVLVLQKVLSTST